jgi:hypothetical protein
MVVYVGMALKRLGALSRQLEVLEAAMARRSGSE